MRITKVLGNPIKKSLIIMICISVGLGLAISGTMIFRASAEESEKESLNDLDIIVLDKEDYEKDRKGPVRFEHKMHAREYKILCWECHHEYEDGANIYSPWGTTMKCDDCHDPEEKMDEVVKLQTAFHLLCKTCHEKSKIYGDEPLAYRKCNRCHEKSQ